jgi:hypothetical protein
MLLEVDVDAAAGAGDATRSDPPPRHLIAAIGFGLEKIETRADDIHLPADPEAFPEEFNTLIVRLLEHQRFTHICEYITEYI